MVQGFKEFILRGNLIELAVAFIMGGAFALVVTEFTGIIMSIVSAIIGGPPTIDSMIIGTPERGVQIGPFLNAAIAFVLVALVLYLLVVMPYNKIKERQAKGQEPVVAEPTADQVLLTEIRDLLKSR